MALVRPKKWLFVILFYFCVSGCIELIQPFVNRYGEWLDLLANGSGLCIGMFIATISRKLLDNYINPLENNNLKQFQKYLAEFENDYTLFWNSGIYNEETIYYYLIETMKIGADKKDWGLQELVFNFTYSIQSEKKQIEILNQLLVIENHHLHQEILRELQLIGSPTSVPYIEQLLSKGFDVLDSYSEAPVIAKWFSWALFDIGTQSAISVMEKYAQSDNIFLAEEMQEKLKRINKLC